MEGYKKSKRWKKMEYVYAALLLHKAGKPIDEGNMTKLLKATGINVDPIRVKALIASLEDVDIDEAIKTVPTVMMPTAPAAASGTEAKPEAKEEKKSEKEEKEKEEAALEGLGALFG
jgi:large subunit ribosomal protein L12